MIELEIEDILFRFRAWAKAQALGALQELSLEPGEELDPETLEHHRGELFQQSFIVTASMVREGTVSENSSALSGTIDQKASRTLRLSCHRFRANEVRLQLAVHAYNLGNLWRRLVLPNGSSAAHEWASIC